MQTNIRKYDFQNGIIYVAKDGDNFAAAYSFDKKTQDTAADFFRYYGKEKTYKNICKDVAKQLGWL